MIFKNYDYLFDTFDNVRIIFLLRNIIDVCQSWENRRTHSIQTNGKWPFERGCEEAVAEWNLSLAYTIEALAKYPDQILVVQYEDLYNKEALLPEIFNFITLEITENVSNFWKQNNLEWNRRDKNRLIRLSSSQKRFICANADFNKYNKLKALIS